MNKKLLSALIGAAIAGAVTTAQADVTLFGQLDLSADVRDADGGGDDANMNSNRSSVGVKGYDQISDNLKGIFMVDFQVDLDDGDVDDTGACPTPESSVPGTAPTTQSACYNEQELSSGFEGRDQWIGLEAKSLGTVRLGTISTAYKEHGTKIDPFARTALDGRDIGIQSLLHDGKGDSGQGRATNTVRYDSPSFAGVSASAHYTLDNSEDDGEDNDPVGASIRFENDALLGFVDYLTTRDGDEDEAIQVGGGLKFLQSYRVYAQYELDEGLISSFQNPITGNKGADMWHVGAEADLGSVLAYFAYGQGDDDDVPLFLGLPASSEYDIYSFGLKYNFSLRTAAYMGFSEKDFDEVGEVDLLSFGVHHRF